jgi:copper transport protein
VRLVRAGLGLLVAATVAGLWLQAPYRSGGGPLDVSAADLSAVLASGPGTALLVRLGIVATVAALLPPLLRGRAGRPRMALLLVLALAGLATWPLAGHAVASPVPAASILAAVVHLAAMAAWLGGLVVLVGVLLRRAHPRVLAVILPVWSRWATIAVVWLVGGGAVQAVIEVGAPRSLIGSDYGRLVAAKVALLVAVLVAAGYARRSVRRRTAPADGHGRLGRAVALEVAGIAVVLGLSAVLVQTTPGRSAAGPAGAAAFDGFAQTLTSPLYTLQFDVYPVQLGENNTVHAYVYTPDGRPLRAVEWKLTAALPSRGVEPVTTPLLGIGEHHGIGAVTFPVPGDWQLRFTIRTSEIDQATVSTTVRVP